MARVGPDVVKVQVTTVSSTGAFRDITQQVQEISGLMVEAMLQDARAFSDSWGEQAFVGVRTIGDITLSGIYDDDTSTGVGGIFANATDVGAERVLKLNLGTTNLYPKLDFLVKSFARTPDRGTLTGWSAVLVPTGALTVVTT